MNRRWKIALATSSMVLSALLPGVTIATSQPELAARPGSPSLAKSGNVCGLRVDRSLWCWGDGQSGQIGDGTRQARLRPALVGHGAHWLMGGDDDRYGRGVHADHSGYCWGANWFARLGTGDIGGRLWATPIV